MDFDLPAAGLVWLNGGAVLEAEGLECAAEGEYVLGEGEAEIGGVATGVEAAEVVIEGAFGGPDAGGVVDDGWGVDGGDGVVLGALLGDPVKDVGVGGETGERGELQS